jgi:hypothetical protein
MQIKKGPYGYYALEKFDDPEALCTYAEEVIAGNSSDFYLKPSTEYLGRGIMCSFEFSGYMQITDPEFSVFSPGRKNTPNKKELKNLSLRRKSAGDLFYTFVKLLDNLVSPSCIVLDPDMIFTDPEGITIKLCCLPKMITPEELCLSSLDALKLEKLLNCDFFKNVISDDEKNALVYSVRENNEDMFLKVAGIIRGSDEDGTPFMKSHNASINKPYIELPHSIKELSKTEKDLLIACLSAVLSIVLLLNKMALPCFLFFFLSAVILAVSILNQKKHEEFIRKEESQEKSKQRSSILFSDDPVPEYNTEQSQTETNNETVRQYKPLTSGMLTLISDSEGVRSKYSVYLDETCIGSDCFLSDIVIDDPNIAPLHAVIKQKEGSFYLVPSKGTGRTYIEDSPIENGKSYEIKSGQKITFGDIEFRFSN